MTAQSGMFLFIYHESRTKVHIKNKKLLVTETKINPIILTNTIELNEISEKL